jgi:hypothetical protein
LAPMKKKRLNYDLIFLFLILPLAYFIYRQGLPGGFVLDDAANLELLANTNAKFSIPDLYTFLVQQGIAGPLGRPISLFTFYLQRESWPSQPENFRHIGIVIHLFNGALVYIFISKLASKLANTSSNHRWIPFVVATIWLIHPINASSVLYIIQRMTTLSSTFVLVGCILYLKYIDAINIEKNFKSSIFYLVAVIAAGVFAILSKESGGLLLLYIFCMQIAIPNQHNCTLNRIVAFTTHILVYSFFFYLIHSLIFSTWANRDFTPVERLITEARILIEYLYKILIPSSNNLHLFYDDYLISRSILTPLSTLFSIVIIIGLILAAITLKKKNPIFAFSCLWFFLGHSLESTTIGLELYFDHRNYLPMLGPIFLLANSLNSLDKVVELNSKLISIITFIYITLLAGVLYAQAQTWSDPTKQALIWAKSKPNSLRAQEYAVVILANKGYVVNAAEVVTASAQRNSNELSPWLSLARLKCMDDRVIFENSEKIVQRFKTATQFRYIENSLQELVEATIGGHCPDMIRSFSNQVVDALLINPAKIEKDRLHYMKAMLLHANGDSSNAISHMIKSFDLNKNIELLIIIANWQALSGHYADSCQTTRKAKQYLNSSKNNAIYSQIILDKIQKCAEK